MSKLEDDLVRTLSMAGVPEPIREHRFAKEAMGRQWRFDLCWPDAMLAVEVDGGAYSGGRHTRGAGFEGDCDKGNAAVELGWRVLHFTGKHIRSGEALATIERVLKNT